MSGITSSEPDFLLASPQLTIFPRHSTLIFPTAAGKLTTERPEPGFRRQFLPISRKWPELEAAAADHVGAVLSASLISSPGHANMLRFSRAVAAHVGAGLPAKPYFFAGSRQHAPVFPV